MTSFYLGNFICVGVYVGVKYYIQGIVPFQSFILKVKLFRAMR